MATRRPGAKRRRINLANLRLVAQQKQTVVAEKADMFQPEVSKLERRASLDDVMVATLRRYVEALGGELQLWAVLNGKRYELRGETESDEP